MTARVGIPYRIVGYLLNTFRDNYLVRLVLTVFGIVIVKSGKKNLAVCGAKEFAVNYLEYICIIFD